VGVVHVVAIVVVVAASGRSTLLNTAREMDGGLFWLGDCADGWWLIWLVKKCDHDGSDGRGTAWLESQYRLKTSRWAAAVEER
jgi:hypothetical protein